VSGEVGVGGGVISDGRLVTGTNGFAGEIGHIPVNPTGERCSCGAIGCFETELGEAALLRRVGYDGSGRAEVDRLIAHAEAGDASVAAALDEHARWLAFGLSGPLNLLDLDLVVLGGLLGRIFPHIETALERELADRALIANRTTPVVAASLGEDAAAIGAAEFTWDRIIAGVGMRLGTAN
jgi:predicted NBD/HSP70 family sugar kinase